MSLYHSKHSLRQPTYTWHRITIFGNKFVMKIILCLPSLQLHQYLLPNSGTVGELTIHLLANFETAFEQRQFSFRGFPLLLSTLIFFRSCIRFPFKFPQFFLLPFTTLLTILNKLVDTCL